MKNITLGNIPSDVFKVNASAVSNGSRTRDQIVKAGRLLTKEYAVKGQNALNKVNAVAPVLNSNQYRELNEKFQADHMLYAAKIACDAVGTEAPDSYDAFKRQALNFYGNSIFYRVLQGIYQEIITPIIPAVYSTAVDTFADVVEVGFGETAQITVDSNDIPIFQDSSWGAQRSIPRNRFYAKDYVLNPQPKACYITAKWTQLVGLGFDFGKFFANVTAGMYAKTVGMWNAAMVAAASDTTLIPSGLTQTFSSLNWVALANKIATASNTSIDNVVAFGGAVALAKVLPTQATGSTNADMDAALAMLLGESVIRSGYLGEFYRVRLQQLTDAVIPGTQNSTISTILPANKIWLMASNGRKPMTIAYNRETPITFEIDPEKSADFEIGMIMTTALDCVAIFSSKVGIITI